MSQSLLVDFAVLLFYAFTGKAGSARNLIMLFMEQEQTLALFFPIAESMNLKLTE